MLESASKAGSCRSSARTLRPDRFLFFFRDPLRYISRESSVVDKYRSRLSGPHVNISLLYIGWLFLSRGGAVAFSWKTRLLWESLLVTPSYPVRLIFLVLSSLLLRALSSSFGLLTPIPTVGTSRGTLFADLLGLPQTSFTSR